MIAMFGEIQQLISSGICQSGNNDGYHTISDMFNGELISPAVKLDEQNSDKDENRKKDSIPGDFLFEKHKHQRRCDHGKLPGTGNNPSGSVIGRIAKQTVKQAEPDTSGEKPELKIFNEKFNYVLQIPCAFTYGYQNHKQEKHMNKT